MELSKNESKISNGLKLYILSSLFAALTAAGAFIKIPLPYVPITLQTYFVILAGTVLGPKFGALSQIIYLAVGLSGVPIFANGGGPGYILQPTFGYLLGCPIGAYIIGYLIKIKTISNNYEFPSLSQLCMYSFLGIIVILGLGAFVLYFNLKFIVHKPISMGTIWVSYFLVFIPGDIIKIFIGALTSLKLYRVIFVYKNLINQTI